MQNMTKSSANIVAENNRNSSLSIFESKEFGVVRTIKLNDKIYFCASDVAKSLGYKNPRDAILRHCKGVVKHDGVSKTVNQHGTVTEQVSEMSFIPEGDVYRLIAHSKLESAQKFESWVFDEVLPSIRETGSYSIKHYSTNELYEMLIQSTINLNNAMAGLSIQQQNQSIQLNSVSDRVTKIEQRVEQRQALLPPPEMDIKSRINKLVRDYAKLHDNDFHSAWSKLYEDYGYRTHTNPSKCAKNRGLKTIEFLEQEKKLDLLEAIASEIFSA